jgi:hypothetical protein
LINLGIDANYIDTHMELFANKSKAFFQSWDEENEENQNELQKIVRVLEINIEVR